MPHTYKVVVIEDEEKIARMIKDYLEKEGMTIFLAGDGTRGMELIKRYSPDLLILDLMLPDLDGLEICRRLRREENIPIIMLTARSQETDRVVGLEMGADDYMVKPFSLAELAARIRAVMRRAGEQGIGSKGEGSNKDEAKILSRGELQIDVENRSVKKGDREVELTPTEFKILSLMARYPGRVFSRLQLLESCLGEAYSGYERSIDTHISNLRKKIEEDVANPSYIVTVFGFGYKFMNK
ncbi:MAG: response regulator transcription factor [Bacillota bacterium]